MIKKIIILLIFVIAVILIRQSDFADLLTFEALKANSDSLRSYVEANKLMSATLFLIIYITVAGLNLPGAVVLSLSGGFVFGALSGTILAVTGATIGAGVGFLMSRYLLGASLNVKYEDQLRRFNEELSSNGYIYMLTLRLIPIFPFFFLINILAGLTRLKLSTFFMDFIRGDDPGGFVFVYAGSRLNEIESIGDIFSLQMLSAFVLLGLSMLVPVAYKKAEGAWMKLSVIIPVYNEELTINDTIEHIRQLGDCEIVVCDYNGETNKTIKDKKCYQSNFDQR